MAEPWPQLIERLTACRRCHEEKLLFREARPLFCKARPQRSDLLFVLEAPNHADTFDAGKGYLTVEADTDPSGVFFRELYTDVLGEPIEEAVITNAVLCLPAARGKRFPVTGKTMRTCSPNLSDQIASLDPLVVVTLGGKALDATRLIEDHGLRKLGDAVAKTVPWFGRVLFPCFHTGMLARNGLSGRRTEKQREDWAKLRDVLHQARTVPRAR